MWNAETGQANGGKKFKFEVIAPCLISNAFEGPTHGTTGIIDENVQVPESAYGLRDKVRALIRAFHIRLYRQDTASRRGNLVGHAIQRFAAASGDDDRCTLCGKPSIDLLKNPQELDETHPAQY